MLIHNHANVFSRTSLDIGARFMLDNLPIHSARKVIDLGCGNGVLGLSLLAKDSEVEVTFIDESHMAVASARLNVEHNLPDCPAAGPLPWSTTVSTTLPSERRTGSSAIPPSISCRRSPITSPGRCSPTHTGCCLRGVGTLDSRQPSSGLSQQTQALVCQRTSRCVEQQIRYFESHQTLK